MSSFKQKIAASKAMPRQTIDVSVSLDRDLSERRDALLAELALAKSSNDDRMSAPTEASKIQASLDAILAEDDDSLVTLRFTRLPGDAWNKLGRMCPPDPGSNLDLYYRYNLDGVCKLAAKYVDVDGTAFGHVVEGDILSTTKEWDELFSAISGPEFSLIVDALYSLNVYGPSERLAELKKRSASLTA